MNMFSLKRLSNARRLPLLALGILALLAALWAGLLRMGWELPPLTPNLPRLHGPLMIAGSRGTLVRLHRPVALGRGWALATPLLSALVALGLLAGVPEAIGRLLLMLGSLGLVAIYLVILRRQRALHSLILTLGGLLWLIGN